MNLFWYKLLTDYQCKAWPDVKTKSDDEDESGHSTRATKRPPYSSVPYQQQQVPPDQDQPSYQPKRTIEPNSMEAFAADQETSSRQQEPENAEHPPLRRTESRRYDPKDPSSRRRRELGDPLEEEEYSFRRAPEEVPSPEEEPPPWGEPSWGRQRRAEQERLRHGTSEPGLQQYSPGAYGEPLEEGEEEPYEPGKGPKIEHQGPKPGWEEWNPDIEEWEYTPFKPGEEIVRPFGKLNGQVLKNLLNLGGTPAPTMNIEAFRRSPRWGNYAIISIPAVKGGWNLQALKTVLEGKDPEFPQDIIPDVIEANISNLRTTNRSKGPHLTLKVPIGDEKKYVTNIARFLGTMAGGMLKSRDPYRYQILAQRVLNSGLQVPDEIVKKWKLSQKQEAKAEQERRMLIRGSEHRKPKPEELEEQEEPTPE